QLDADHQELKILHQKILEEVKHLQTDLKETKIHKEHAEKELGEVKNKLDSANAILNKPKPVMVEMGTQTELTLYDLERMGKKLVNLTNLGRTRREKNEQIQGLLKRMKVVENQVTNLYEDKKHLLEKGAEAEQRIEELNAEMDKKNLSMGDLEIKVRLLEETLTDLEKYQQDIQKEQNKVSALQTKLANLRQEIKNLEEKLKEGDLNEIEKELFGYVEKRLVSKEAEVEMVDISNDIFPITSKIELENNQQTIKDLTQKKNELQIQLDLATKTKEQLAEELQKEKGWGEYPEIVSEYHSFVVLMISLEKTLGIPIKTHNNLNQSEIVKMEEYREGKSFAELRKNWEKGYFKPGVYPELDAEYEKLFEE
ncbi:7954_t:CDS:2, partial [Cetraspora pellucida]